MSNVIQPRNYSVGQAVLLQQRPGALVDAGEYVHAAAARQYQQQFYGGAAQATKFNVVVLGTGGVVILSARTSADPASPLLDADWAPRSESAVSVANLAPASWWKWSETTKNAFCKGGSAAAPAAASRLRVERLVAIQAALGLSTLDTAQVLGVTRQALYKWLDAKKDVTLQEASRERLACIERLAKHWRERSASPLSALAKQPLPTGQTIIQMMSADVVNEAAVIAAFNVLFEQLQAKPKSLSQKLMQAGLTRRPTARTLPREE